MGFDYLKLCFINKNITIIKYCMLWKKSIFFNNNHKNTLCKNTLIHIFKLLFFIKVVATQSCNRLYKVKDKEDFECICKWIQKSTKQRFDFVECAKLFF